MTIDATNWFEKWLSKKSTAIGTHQLTLFAENSATRKDVLVLFLEQVRSHYLDPATTAKRLSDLGAGSVPLIVEN